MDILDMIILMWVIGCSWDIGSIKKTATRIENAVDNIEYTQDRHEEIVRRLVRRKNRWKE